MFQGRPRLIIFSNFVTILSIDGLYEINLDRRKLKTPGGKLFTVPNEALAIAVATEWDAQRGTLKFYTMHLVWDIFSDLFIPQCVASRTHMPVELFLQTTLCNTALDNPTQRNKEQMINSALKFLETDTIWYGFSLDCFCPELMIIWLIYAGYSV